MSQYTPLPLSANKRGEIRNSNGIIIGHTVPELAPLFAASPELLEAFKQVVRDIEAWNDAVENIIGRQPQTNIALDKARAAIANAEGRAS